MYNLSKKYILKKNRHFQAVYRQGKSYANRLAVLYVLPSTGFRRIGFAAGKKLGGAVVRNRLKRIMREAYRLNQTWIIDRHDLVFVARKPMLEAKTPQVVKALLDLCQKAKLIAREGDGNG